jgi:hypothetical protein
MSKKLAGKRWFYALGQSHAAHKLPPMLSNSVPDWAKLSYVFGRNDMRLTRVIYGGRSSGKEYKFRWGVVLV